MIDKKQLTHKILDNGYEIYLDGGLWITQLDEYSKPIDKDKTFEENCLLQIEEITAPVIKELYNQEQYDAVLVSLIEEGRL